MIPVVINTMLSDIIYENFDVEEEDQMKNMMGQDIVSDPEIGNLLGQIEAAMYKILSSG